MNNEKKIHNLLSKYLGTSGIAKAESFMSGRKNVSNIPIKAYNPVRHMEAYAFIKVDKYRTDNIKNLYTIAALNAKTRGEASEVLNKVKNFGKDMWRLIKELLGKLIIVIEEQFYKLFDKSKKYEKVIDELAVYGEKLKNTINKKGEFDGEDVIIELPKGKGATSSDFETSSKNLLERDAQFLNTFDKLDKLFVNKPKSDADRKKIATEAKGIINGYKDALGKIKDVKNLNGLFKELLKLIEKGEQTKGEQTKGEQTNGIDVTSILYIYVYGVTQAELLEIENKVKKLKNKVGKPETVDKYTIDEKSAHAFVEFLNKYISDARTEINLFRKAVKGIFDGKRNLNKMKNLPTKYTNNIKKEKLDDLRTLINGVNKGLHAFHKQLLIKTNNSIIDAAIIIKSSKKLLNAYDVDSDDTKQYTPFKKA